MPPGRQIIVKGALQSMVYLLWIVGAERLHLFLQGSIKARHFFFDVSYVAPQRREFMGSYLFFSYKEAKGFACYLENIMHGQLIGMGECIP